MKAIFVSRDHPELAKVGSVSVEYIEGWRGPYWETAEREGPSHKEEWAALMRGEAPLVTYRRYVWRHLCWVNLEVGRVPILGPHDWGGGAERLDFERSLSPALNEAFTAALMELVEEVEGGARHDPARSRTA